MSTISGVHRRGGESKVGHLQNDINTRGNVDATALTRLALYVRPRKTCNDIHV